MCAEISFWVCVLQKDTQPVLPALQAAEVPAWLLLGASLVLSSAGGNLEPMLVVEFDPASAPQTLS